MLSLVTLVALAIVVTSAIDRMAYARRLKRWRARRTPEGRTAALWRSEDRLMGAVFVVVAIVVAAAMTALAATALGGRAW